MKTLVVLELDDSALDLLHESGVPHYEIPDTYTTLEEVEIKLENK